LAQDEPTEAGSSDQASQDEGGIFKMISDSVEATNENSTFAQEWNEHMQDFTPEDFLTFEIGARATEVVYAFPFGSV
jgi:hypothetical protein